MKTEKNQDMETLVDTGYNTKCETTSMHIKNICTRDF